MLLISRKVGQAIRIGENITVRVVRKRSDGRLVIGIEAPKEILVLREELAGRPDKTKAAQRNMEPCTGSTHDTIC